MSFIHSSEKAVFFFRSRKKKNSFFIHSIGFAQKCVKNELFREKNTVSLIGGTPDKRILRVHFEVFRQSLEFVNYVFRVFIAIIWGTPNKRIPEGLF